MGEGTNKGLEELRKRALEPIAVVGMACRFPGGADTPSALWRLLHDGIDTIEEVPEERWSIDDFYSPDPDEPGKTYVRHGGFVKNVDLFDPQFFGITPKEAKTMDPQQRLLLEVTWEALENAGQPPEELHGSRTAVFIGMCGTDYSQMMLSAGLDRLTGYMGSGSAHSIAAGRLSYFFGLQGPCLTVDTACSSSLATVYMAFQSLRRRDCILAVVAGVNLVLSPELTIVFSKMRMLSPEGRCKTFDASADGYTRSDGCGVVILKRQSDALRDGDRILALVRGGAINQDGHSSGLTVPNGAAQQALLREALLNSGVDAAQVSYLETHGTGTALGDPIEVNAIGAVFARTHDAANRVALGSVKANLGHLEGAAGIASFIKTVLALEHREIPANIHFKHPNPHIPWKDLPVHVPTSLEPWQPRDGGVRIAGISAFGFSGTNVHVVAQEAAVPEARPEASERPLHILPLSAKSQTALRELAGRYSRYLESSSEPLPDICYTASAGRSHFAHRVAAAAASSQDLGAKLAAFVERQDMPGIWSDTVSAGTRNRVAFLFTGQGSHYPNMGRRLYESEPVFRRTLEECDALLKVESGQSLLSLMHGDEDAQARLEQTSLAQPVLFSLEYALAQMWMSWDIQPAAVMGHSLGEYVAACVSGVFPLKEALKLVVERGRLMQSAAKDGRMLAVASTANRVSPCLERYSNTVSIAAINGPENIVLSGPARDVTAIGSELNANGIHTQMLAVQAAFHSPLMDPILEAFEKAAQRLSCSPPKIPLISNVTGRSVGNGERLDAGYWRAHLRSPVRFESGVQALADRGCNAFLEIGPGTTLLGLAMKCLPQEDPLWLPSLRSSRDDWEQVLESMAKLYIRGGSIDWKAFDRGHCRRKVELPNYPFERSRCWFEEKNTGSRARVAKSDSPQSGTEEWRGWFYRVAWQVGDQLTATAAEIPSDERRGKWLVLGDSAGVGVHLNRMMLVQGYDSELLPSMCSMPELSATIDRMAAGEFRGIVHLWSLDTSDGSQLNPSNLATAQKLTCEALLQTLQVLQAKRLRRPPRIWAATAGAQNVVPGDRISPAQSLTWGFGRTIALEHPELWGGLIDLPWDGAPEAQAGVVLQEIWQMQSEDQVAWRGKQRYVPRLVPVLPGGSSYPAFSIRPASTYLVTGGLGKLGLKVAKWLVAQGATDLVLTGRRGLEGATQETIATIQTMRTSGTHIDILAVDAGDEEQVRSLAKRLKQKPPLAGVVAAAGAFSRAPLDTTPFDRLEPVFRAKVTGTWLLGKLVREFEPDFFVLFSSITSLLGTRFLAHYAAACQFQDAFAAFYRSLGKPALAINWGLWDETSGDVESDQAFRLSGNRPMPSAQALSALGYLLGKGETQTTVASIDWERLKPLYEAKRSRPLLALIDAAAKDTRREAERTPRQPELRVRFAAALPDNRSAVARDWVIATAARILGMQVSAILPEMNFAEMGMDSLMASEMRNSLQADAGLLLPNALGYEYPTIQKLSDYLTSRLQSSLGSPENPASVCIRPVDRTVQRTSFPLSLAQQNFSCLYRDNVAFNIPVPYHIVGRLNVPVVEAVLAELVRRHEDLRMTFQTHNGRTAQLVSATARIQLIREDLSSTSAESRQFELQRAVARCSETAFDLQSAPLLKTWILNLGEAESVLLFVAHHLIFDVWSVKVLVREFETLYNAFASNQPSPLLPLEIQYVDFAEWQTNQVTMKEELEYWRLQFDGKLPSLPFPKNGGIGDPDVAMGEKCRDVLSAALVERLKRVGSDASQTLFTLMFTAFGLLVHHYSGQDEVLLLSADAGRSLRETEGLIGMFAAPLLVRGSFAGDPRFTDLLEQVRGSFLAALAHELPLQPLIESFGVNGRRDVPVLSQVFFDSLPEMPIHMHLKDLESATYFPTQRERLRHDLELYIRPIAEGIYCALWCNRSLFSPSFPRRMMDDLVCLLKRVADQPTQRISALLQDVPSTLAGEEKFERSVGS